MKSSDVDSAVLLIAHGSRRAEANADLARVAEGFAAKSGRAIVEIAYLEIAEPTIPQGGAACAARGARRVMLLPYFLSAGAHVVEDLERHCRELAAKHPEIEFRLCPPLGLHPALLDALLDRLNQGERGA